jgi:hypothetical protein
VHVLQLLRQRRRDRDALSVPPSNAALARWIENFPTMLSGPETLGGVPYQSDTTNWQLLIWKVFGADW